MALNQLLTNKQLEVLRSYLTDDWKYLILTGAVRAGKTVIDNYLFLLELKRIAKLAAKNHDPHPLYILAGYSSNSIYTNVIAELETQFGIELRTDKHGHYHYYGIDIVPAYTGSIRGLGAIRGATSYGAYINEASLADHGVFQEIIQRCSIPSARIICDTNPDIPTHWLKTDYIDNHDPAARIKSFSFTIDDNTFLSQDYVNSLKAATPKGMYYDRAILGQWVTGEGVVYDGFNAKTMLVNSEDIPNDLNYYVGVDWGFEHKNSIVLLGDDPVTDITYLIREITNKHKLIGELVAIAQDLQVEYGTRIPFYCDSARPDNIREFQVNGINALLANKKILPGVECVTARINQDKFRVNKAGVKDFLTEVYQYHWNEKTGEPEKGDNGGDDYDVMDALRYGIYTKRAKGGFVPWK